MARRKLIPTRLSEVIRLINDLRVGRKIGSENGRREFWDRLAAECRGHSMIALLEAALALDGDVIECGVYRGYSLLRMARAIFERAPEKTLFGLDSFQGFPESEVTARDLGPGRSLRRVRSKFRFCADTPRRLQTIGQSFGLKLELVPGFFSETLPRFRDHRFCFIHLDCDLYASYKQCLEFLYDRLVPGGVIVFDDWGSADWPGAARAVEEFLDGRLERVERCTERHVPAFYVRTRPAR